MEHSTYSSSSAQMPNSPLDERFLTNLLKHISLNFRSQNDPRLKFLEECSGFALFICAVSYHSSSPQSMIQLSLQQDRLVSIMLPVLREPDAEYLCLSAEIENRIVALFVRKDSHRIRSGEFSLYIHRKLDAALARLHVAAEIPMQSVFSTEENAGRLQQVYKLLGNAIGFLDYMEKTSEQILYVEGLRPQEHMDLWNSMEESNASFISAFLQNRPKDAVACVNSMVDVIASWVPMSRDSLLSDVQHYFDALMEKLSSQFGEDVIRGISIARIFETECLSELYILLSDIVDQLFSNVRRNTSDNTFQRMSEVSQYIDLHLTEYSLSANSIAQNFGISPQLLSVQFKRCFGATPLQYIEQKRVDLICSYLSKTDLSVEAICREVGIGTVATLHRIFLKQTGQTPGAYRKSMQRIRS